MSRSEIFFRQGRICVKAIIGGALAGKLLVILNAKARDARNEFAIAT
ncbi:MULTISPECIES: hypothetical protein [unclassified Mesorhizobium]|nr:MULTISPECIES: hypothetical protein [unclassified Mesorhizobium]MBZ9810188.1 hypothetical protein [Mesorhizobium sp. ESP-6-2]MBZ9944146.1 hypothetical protein [Mesorhizobium sp. BR1-1-13]